VSGRALQSDARPAPAFRGLNTGLNDYPIYPPLVFLLVDLSVAFGDDAFAGELSILW
jgi:hypothetical protein